MNVWPRGEQVAYSQQQTNEKEGEETAKELINTRQKTKADDHRQHELQQQHTRRQRPAMDIRQHSY